MKDLISAAVGMTAGVLSWLVGGFDVPVLALVICMGVDYVTGLIVAGVFHASPKTDGGGLDSRVGWKGLARKLVTVLIVVVANLADLLLEKELATGYTSEEYGFTVESVDGVVADWAADSAYWALYEGEEYATTSAAGIVLTDGGVYKLVYETF